MRMPCAIFTKNIDGTQENCYSLYIINRKIRSIFYPAAGQVLRKRRKDMRRGKSGKRIGFHILSILALVLAFCLPVSAGVQEGKGEYEIYPTPQNVEYGTGTVTLTDKVNVTTGDAIDSYTKTRIDATLEVLGLKKNTSAVTGNTNLIVGVYNSKDAADTWGASHGVDASIYEKYDAYTLWIQGNDIVVLGKNTDAAYYGVTTLKRIFEQLEGKTVKTLTVKDYAEVEFRGFIEGYYGNPWSHEDRVDLMKFGGEIKMNQYVYAPKDDPLHNARWRDLYDEEGLKKVSELAQAGNESKCFYVYALHPFMNNAINLSDSTYDAEVAVLKAKFRQVIEAGVRQIAILEDDAAGETADRVARLLNDMNAWLHELKKEYPDLKTDILYCPTCYMATSDSKLNAINKKVTKEIHFVMTGGKIWGEVSSSFADNFYKGLANDGTGRYPYMWVNWPCNDNTKTSQIMGGHNYILHTGVDGKKYEGVILNPIQESESSKVAIFTAADFCWQTWDAASEGDQAWEDAFKYIDHMTAIESKESQALKETAKHMITQGPSQTTAGKQTQFDESVELSPKITAFRQKMNAGTLTEEDTAEMRTELQKIADAAEYYLESGTNRRMASQMIPFLGCLHDVTQAGAYLMDSISEMVSDNKGDLWGGYAEAQALYEKSQTYGFAYYGQGTIYAEAGRKYITPFVADVLKYVAEEVKEVVNPEAAPLTKYTGTYSRTSGWKVYQGTEENMTDGDDATSVWYQTVNNASAAGDYIQLDLGTERQVGRVRVLVGQSGNSEDKWVKYHLKYSVDGKTWTDKDSFTGAGSGMDTYEVNLKGASARYLRVENDQAISKWVKFSEFSAYSPAEGVPEGKMDYTNIENADWDVEYGEASSRVAPKTGAVLQPGEYIGLKLSRIRAVNGITVTGTGTEKLTLEKSMNQSEWMTKDEAGAARYIRLMNKTDAAVNFDLESFVVTSDEIPPMDLEATTIGGENNGEDARLLKTTRNWMDGNLSTKAKYCSFPAKDGYVTYDLGQEITLRSVKIYVLDTAIDYPRDAILQASMDNQNWTDLITIGDGVENTGDANTKPVENDCGYKHDTVDVAYAYVENPDIDNLKARYLRLYFTAPYNSRWVELNEIQINGGEYIPMINDPTFETDAALQRGYEPQNLNDGDLTTAFRPVMADGQKGSLIYNLSDEKAIGRLNILQSGSTISNATVSVRTDADTWVSLGVLDRSFSAFYTKNLEHVYAVKLEWENVTPILYEIITLENPGDVLEKNLADAEKDMNAAEAEVTAAESAVNEIKERVATAVSKVNTAANEEEKLKAEVELQKLYAEQSKAEAVVAGKKVVAAKASAAYAKVEARNLRIQATNADTEEEKNRLEAEAAEKEDVVLDKLTEAEGHQSVADEKEKEQSSYEQAAAAKQAELEKLQAEAEVTAAENAVEDAKKLVTAAVSKVNAAANEEEKLKAEVELQKAYAEQSKAEAVVAEKKAIAARAAAAFAKIEARNLRIQAANADTEEEKDRLEAEAVKKDGVASDKLIEADGYQSVVDAKKKEQASYEQAAAAKQEELEKLQAKPNPDSKPNPDTKPNPTPQPPSTSQPPITNFNYKNVKYKVLDSAKKTVAAVGVTTKKVKSVTVYKTVKKDGTTWKVVEIGAKAFKGCKKLTKVTIGANVTKIGKQAFANCPNLKNVNMKKAAKITSFGKKAFSKINAKAKITVPAKKRAKYKKLLKKAGVPKKAVIK